ncbi:MAG: hypothetical protein HP497_09705 [Nitrospira sp.]|nr:hypothetical protein [Nitrospira sp.]
MIFGILFLGVLLFATPVSAADKGVQHVVGTVAAIDHKHIEVKTPNKAVPVSVKLTKHVQFKNKNNPASTNPPGVGDRVIIEATKDNKKLVATIVYYSTIRQVPSAPQ